MVLTLRMRASRGDWTPSSEEALGGDCLCAVRKVFVCANSVEFDVIRSVVDIVGTNKKISSARINVSVRDAVRLNNLKAAY